LFETGSVSQPIALIADDLELLLEPLRHPFDHVGHEGAGETVERLVLVLIRGTAHDNLAVLERHLHRRVERARKLALRPLHRDFVPIQGRRDVLRDRDRLLSNA